MLFTWLLGLVIAFVIYRHLTRQRVHGLINPGIDFPILRNWPRFYRRRHLGINSSLETMKELGECRWVK